MPNLTIERNGKYGVIESADKSWVIFLDADGRPSTYWAKRGEDGEVIGEPVEL